MADDVPYEDRWGRFYSAYSPVFSSSGDVAAVVTVDFDVEWYEKQLNQNTWTIVFACGLFLSVGILLVVILTRQYGKMIEEINASLNDLADDMSALTEDTSDASRETKHFDLEDEGIMQVKKRISILQKDLHDHIGHINTQANSMITAMASDYRCVYYVNLDENDGVCYRGPERLCSVERGRSFSVSGAV